MTPGLSRSRAPVARAAARGRPSTIAKTNRVSPTNASRRQPRKAATTRLWPASKPARTMRSSLKNGPNGGQAVTASIPTTNIRAESGDRHAMPATSSTVRPPAARRMLPAVRNSAPLVRLLFQT